MILGHDGPRDIFGPFDHGEAFKLALELKHRRTKWSRKHLYKRMPERVCVQKGDPSDRNRVECACDDFKFPEELQPKELLLYG